MNPSKTPGRIEIIKPMHVGHLTETSNKLNSQPSTGLFHVGCLRSSLTRLFTALLVLGFWLSPALAEVCDTCTPCHGDLANIHGNFNHTATPGTGEVAIFADTDHDSAGWVGTRPFFGIEVDCALCHNADLPKVHGDDCATCHPTPYDTLGTWNKGCQQGGCHVAIHQDIVPSHYPWEYTGNSTQNDCSICHGPNWWPTQTACVKCHAPYGPGDVSPPTTKTDALAEYIGPAKIGFSITDNGKVGVGRTFYQLDGGPATAAGKNLFITDDTPGQHELKFWSKDQSGNTEPAPKTVLFNIIEDSTAPTTTSNAQANYTQGGLITLTATDASTLGVKNTYYTINGGPVQTGTKVGIPVLSGIIPYTLAFWSEDWAGNIETQHVVNFTVTGGTGKLRLVWGNSDVDGPPCAGDPEASASWVIRRGSWSGPIVATGSGACPNWSGVNDITLPIGYSYYLLVDWWDSYYGWDDQSAFSNVALTTPGQIIRLSY